MTGALTTGANYPDTALASMNTCDVVTYYYKKRVLYNVSDATGGCGQRGKVLFRLGVHPAVGAISAMQ